VRTTLVGVAAVAAAGVVVGASAGGSAHPSLRLVDREPIRVRGEHFRPAEVVRLTVILNTSKTARHVRAGTKGRFVATFRGRAWLGACSPGLTVLAVGARGSRALLKLPAAACPPRP
jgi:hypothetical protein